MRITGTFESLSCCKTSKLEPEDMCTSTITISGETLPTWRAASSGASKDSTRRPSSSSTSEISLFHCFRGSTTMAVSIECLLRRLHKYSTLFQLFVNYVSLGSGVLLAVYKTLQSLD